MRDTLFRERVRESLEREKEVLFFLLFISLVNKDENGKFINTVKLIGGLRSRLKVQLCIMRVCFVVNLLSIQIKY